MSKQLPATNSLDSLVSRKDIKGYGTCTGYRGLVITHSAFKDGTAMYGYREKNHV
jgi:hypothetical protein